VKLVVAANVLVRAVMRDDEAQAAIAVRLLAEAEVIAVPTASLCEFVWVLRRLYRLDAADVAAAIEALLNAANVETQRSTVEAGLGVLRAGGDFADGVIAHEGRLLGGETFASFDRQAVTLLAARGVAVIAAYEGSVRYA
jgi:predicted nucleic-acid-binding protein